MIYVQKYEFQATINFVSSHFKYQINIICQCASFILQNKQFLFTLITYDILEHNRINYTIAN